MGLPTRIFRFPCGNDEIIQSRRPVPASKTCSFSAGKPNGTFCPGFSAPDRSGATLTNAAQARAEARLTLHFGDGKVDASVDGAPASAPVERKRKSPYIAPQPGLFDRRAERGNAAQSVVLDEALTQCADRLGYLARLRVPARGALALMFAVALE